MSTKDPLLIGNWKMHKTSKEAAAFVKEFNKKIKRIEYFNLAVCVPATALDAVSRVLNRDALELGAQNMFYESEGAFTGEISPLMLKEFNVKYVLVGHSERRLLGETDELINTKVHAALKYGFKPVVCVGESDQERKKGKYKQFVLKQLKACLKEISKKEVVNVIIAYEPIWAISRGDNNHQSAQVLEIEEMHSFIRASLMELYDERTAEAVYIIYGGSVKPSNIKQILFLQDVDGVLPGSASLTVESFIEMIKNC